MAENFDQGSGHSGSYFLPLELPVLLPLQEGKRLSAGAGQMQPEVRSGSTGLSPLGDFTPSNDNCVLSMCQVLS